MALANLANVRREIYRAGQTFFYYELSKKERDACWSKFKALDENGDKEVSFQELLDTRGSMDPSIADRVCRSFELVDRDGSGFLDFEECKALFFLVAKARFCYGCDSLIIRDGVFSHDCVPHSFNFCCYCAHHHQQQQQQYYQHRFQALPELINGSLQRKLPPVIPLRAFPQQQQQQHYHHSHGFQSLRPLVSSRPQLQLPSDHEAVAPSQAFHHDNAWSDNRGFAHNAGTVFTFVGNVVNLAVAINSCSIM